MSELVPALLDMVDAGKVAFNPAIELSYLTRTEQASLLDAVAEHEATPSLSHAQRLKKYSKPGA